MPKSNGKVKDKWRRDGEIICCAIDAICNIEADLLTGSKLVLRRTAFSHPMSGHFYR